MAKYRNKYRIESTRASWWNYGWDASYFVTICTKHREHFFGEVIRGEMRLSAIGQAAEVAWAAIPDHFPFVRLGEWVVMPNHVHGIITIDKKGYVGMGAGDLDGGGDPAGGGDPDGGVETQNIASPPPSQSPSPPLLSPSPPSSSPPPPHNKFGPQSQNLASIVRGFKVGVTKAARRIDPDFAWQSRYHDVIIRDAGAYGRIAAYIVANPRNWKEDRFS